LPLSSAAVVFSFHVTCRIARFTSRMFLALFSASSPLIVSASRPQIAYRRA
jgi:hypothetical protein